MVIKLFSKIQSSGNVSSDIFNRTSDNIAATLNPIASQPQSSGQILTKVALTTGSNTIKHGLNRNLIGWQIVRQRASATIYDTQDSNPTPSQTLLLTTSANVTVDIEVF